MGDSTNPGPKSPKSLRLEVVRWAATDDAVFVEWTATARSVLDTRRVQALVAEARGAG